MVFCFQQSPKLLGIDLVSKLVVCLLFLVACVGFVCLCFCIDLGFFLLHKATPKVSCWFQEILLSKLVLISMGRSLKSQLLSSNFTTKLSLTWFFFFLSWLEIFISSKYIPYCVFWGNKYLPYLHLSALEISQVRSKLDAVERKVENIGYVQRVLLSRASLVCIALFHPQGNKSLLSRSW